MTAHPAKFSAPILTEAARQLERYAGGRRLRVLDPFAGTGLVHTLEPHETWGVEIEPEWAAMHPRTIVGDALRMPFRADTFDAIVTSPTYGNRMADQYDGAGRCRRCSGVGDLEGETCTRCGGSGRDRSKRYTYRIALKRPPHARSTVRLAWGPGYWHRHWSAWVEARRVLRPGGIFILNVSDFEKAGELIPVVGWHRARLIDLGFVFAGCEDVTTARMGHGANRDARADAENVLIFYKPRS